MSDSTLTWSVLAETNDKTRRKLCLPLLTNYYYLWADGQTQTGIVHIIMNVYTMIVICEQKVGCLLSLDLCQF